MLFLYTLITFSALGAETQFKLSEIQTPEVLVEGASFETLRRDSFLPTRKISLESARSTTLDSLNYATNFPPANYGYPSGANALSLGGRSSTDTQVTTLGVPLNLAQGGGSDFSSLPSFLWQYALISPTLTSSGFTPTAASGSVEFIPWSRERVLNQNPNAPLSRLTATYDRQLQTFSLATRKDTIAILGGMTTGLMTGPAGEASFKFYQGSSSRWIAHVIGTDQTGEVPSNSPLSKKRAWRVIPVLESEHRLNESTMLQSTFFSDLGGLRVTDPINMFNESNTRTQQYGVENALVNGPNRFALSGRYVHFTDAGGNRLHEWPVYGAYTRDLSLGEAALRATVSSTYANSAGVQPGGRISAKFARDPNAYPFLELNSTPKLPTLIDRFAFYPGLPDYRGNPNLKPERVNALLGGYELKSKTFSSKTTAKLEYRTSIIIPTSDYASTKNAGNARLASLEQENRVLFTSWLKLQSNLLLTTSSLMDTHLPYPDVPTFGARGLLTLSPNDRVQLDSGIRYTGPAVASSGAFHRPYTFVDEAIRYQVEENTWVSLGVIDLFDQRSEIVLGFPTPGRMVNLALTAEF